MAANIAFGKDTLKGLTGVAVTAEVLSNPGHKPEGLDSDLLRQIIESQLFQAGVGIYSLEGLANVEQKPILHAKVSVLTTGNAAHIYAVNLFLMQRVGLSGGDSTLAVTWEHGYLGIEPQTDWKSLMKSLAQTVSRFGNDFKAVNS